MQRFCSFKVVHLRLTRGAETRHEPARDVAAEVELVLWGDRAIPKSFQRSRSALELRRRSSSFTSKAQSERNVPLDSLTVGIENGQHCRPAENAADCIPRLKIGLGCRSLRPCAFASCLEIHLHSNAGVKFVGGALRPLLRCRDHRSLSGQWNSLVCVALCLLFRLGVVSLRKERNGKYESEQERK